MGERAICVWGSGVVCFQGCVEGDLVRVEGENCERVME